jgi:hypothetical protein
MGNFVPVSRAWLGPPVLALLAAAALLAPSPVQAAPYLVRLVQISIQGKYPYVQAYASGAFDLTGLTFVYDFGPPGGGPPYGGIGPFYGILDTGSNSTSQAIYTGPAGPTSFGSGYRKLATVGTGDTVGLDASLNGEPRLSLPQGYVSGTDLEGGAIWDDASFASLGVTPGAYTWTWGPGVEQSFTLRTEPAAVSVPEPSTLGLFGLGILLISVTATLRSGVKKGCARK